MTWPLQSVTGPPDGVGRVRDGFLRVVASTLSGCAYQHTCDEVQLHRRALHHLYGQLQVPQHAVADQAGHACGCSTTHTHTRRFRFPSTLLRIRLVTRVAVAQHTHTHTHTHTHGGSGSPARCCGSGWSRAWLLHNTHTAVQVM